MSDTKTPLDPSIIPDGAIKVLEPVGKDPQDQLDNLTAQLAAQQSGDKHPVENYKTAFDPSNDIHTVDTGNGGLTTYSARAENSTAPTLPQDNSALIFAGIGLLSVFYFLIK